VLVIVYVDGVGSRVQLNQDGASRKDWDVLSEAHVITFQFHQILTHSPISFQPTGCKHWNVRLWLIHEPPSTAPMPLTCPILIELDYTRIVLSTDF